MGLITQYYFILLLLMDMSLHAKNRLLPKKMILVIYLVILNYLRK
nr:MAG TPA: hypothetical protein [Caudoviricetes sp.]